MYQPIRWRDQLTAVLAGRRRVLRLTAEQDRLLRRAASIMDAPPSDFVLEAALSKARTVVDLNGAGGRAAEAFERFMTAPEPPWPPGA